MDVLMELGLRKLREQEPLVIEIGKECIERNRRKH
jgi:hypothetical protein